jgi:hypothetical protein
LSALHSLDGSPKLLFPPLAQEQDRRFLEAGNGTILKLAGESSIINGSARQARSK